jgi:stage III sporulation protein AE
MEESAESTQELLDGLSYGEIQDALDQMLGGSSFSFGTYVQKLIQGDFSVFTSRSAMKQCVKELGNAMVSWVVQDKKIMVSLFGIALAGAIFHSFSKLLKGKQVSQTAFLVVYLLFFSVLGTSFYEISALASQTLERLLTFVKILVPSFLISLSFTQGGEAAGIYYELILLMITVADWLLVSFALPGINLYFFLQVANQLSGEDMFSKMAELVKDGIHLGVKTMFGLFMGLQVIQGLLVPVSAQVKNMTLAKMGGALPGIGNSVTSVLQTVLCAGTLVKNAVGVAGMIAVFLVCAFPLLQMVASRFLFQLLGALLQPISDPRLIKGISGGVEAIGLLVYVVGVGVMLFVVSIAMISAFTS